MQYWKQRAASIIHRLGHLLINIDTGVYREGDGTLRCKTCNRKVL